MECFGWLIGWLFLPRASQTLNKCFTAEQYSQPWNVFCYGYCSLCRIQWKGKAGVWALFFYKWSLEDSWGPTLASPSFKDNEKQCSFIPHWCSVTLSPVRPRSEGMKLKAVLLWSICKRCLWESSGTHAPCTHPQCQTSFRITSFYPRYAAGHSVPLEGKSEYLLEPGMPEFLFEKPSSWEVRVQLPSSCSAAWLRARTSKEVCI